MIPICLSPLAWRRCLFKREPAGQPTLGGSSNGADRSRREREGAFGNAVITADVRYSLLTKHYRIDRPMSAHREPDHLLAERREIEVVRTFFDQSEE